MKFMMTIVAGLLSVAAFAAQCAGTTLDGKRCKRDAAEGSKYCIGHAHQAKGTAQSKEKDDGTCWAVTVAGTRCKHKKVGDTDYCAQHAADVKPKKPVSQCCAMTPLLHAAPHAADLEEARRAEEVRCLWQTKRIPTK